MSFSVSSHAQYLFSIYTFNNRRTYSENAVDTASVSKKFNVSNLANALDAMITADSISISSISNLSAYVQNNYKLRWVTIKPLAQSLAVLSAC